MEVDQQPGHCVEQAIAIGARAERKAHQQPAVLKRMGQVFGHEDGRLALGRLGESGSRYGRQADFLEVAESSELALGDLERLLLQRKCSLVGDQETNEVTRRTDRDLAEPIVVPL